LDAWNGGRSRARLRRACLRRIASRWLLVQPVASLNAADAATVARVEQDKDAKTVAGLARRFTALVRACGIQGRQGSAAPAKPAAELDAWLAEARTCGTAPIETFAAGLEQDSAAAHTALTEPWSSGQAEGQVNRLKLLKRQSYGRAGFDLLRRRVLLAARSTQTAGEPKGRVHFNITRPVLPTPSCGGIRRPRREP